MKLAEIAGTTGFPAVRLRVSPREPDMSRRVQRELHQEEVAFAGDIPPAGEHLTLPRTLNPGKKAGCEYSDLNPSITSYIVTFASAQLRRKTKGGLFPFL